MTETLELERRIKARPETIFAYFTDPERYTRWMGIEAVLDARPGGQFKVKVPQGFHALGEFVEVSPYERIVLTWGWEGHGTVAPGSTTVTVTFTPDGDETVVRLVHSGLPSDEEVEMHGHGWNRYLDRLVIAAPGGDPGPDPAPPAPDPA